MNMVRRIGAAVLAVAAIAVWFLMAPEDVEVPETQVREQVRDRSSEIDSALADYELNEARTSGAPQQAVVNGWVTKDLLTIIAEQQNEAFTRPDMPVPTPPVPPDDERIPALVGLVVLGVALLAVTSPAAASGPAAAPGAGPPAGAQLAFPSAAGAYRTAPPAVSPAAASPRMAPPVVPPAPGRHQDPRHQDPSGGGMPTGSAGGPGA